MAASDKIEAFMLLSVSWVDDGNEDVVWCTVYKNLGGKQMCC